jgi:hypothetical protein
MNADGSCREVVKAGTSTRIILGGRRANGRLAPRAFQIARSSLAAAGATLCGNKPSASRRDPRHARLDQSLEVIPRHSDQL